MPLSLSLPTVRVAIYGFSFLAGYPTSSIRYHYPRSDSPSNRLGSMYGFNNLD